MVLLSLSNFAFFAHGGSRGFTVHGARGWISRADMAEIWTTSDFHTGAGRYMLTAGVLSRARVVAALGDGGAKSIGQAAIPLMVLLGWLLSRSF